MSIVCAAIKNGEVAIAADTQLTVSSIVVTAADDKNFNKLIKVNGSVIGLVGWASIQIMIETIIRENGNMFILDDRDTIYKSLNNLHNVMKENYSLITTDDEGNQPIESSQLDGLIINKSGIFDIDCYRSVEQYYRFWATGSGKKYSIGAMEAAYDKSYNAKELVMLGVNVAAKFDPDCSLPATYEVIRQSTGRFTPQKKSVGEYKGVPVVS